MSKYQLITKRNFRNEKFKAYISINVQTRKFTSKANNKFVSINELINESMNESMNESISQSVSQLIISQ